MKEKLSVAIAFSISIMVLLLLISIAFPQISDSETEMIGFAKGVAASIASCLVSLFSVLKYDKRRNSNK